MVTTPADTLTKSPASITTPASATLLVKSSPFSKETIFAADSVPTATKRTGPIAIAFSKKEVIENETLNVRPVKLISSELSAEIRTLKPDMIHFNSEVLLTRFWQLSPEVQQIMTVVDSYVNANTKNFNWLEKIKRPNLNDKLSVTNERIKALRMGTGNIFQWQNNIKNNLEVLEKGIDLLKRNINALKGDKPQDEKVNRHYINHMAGEMESRLKEYKQIIPFMEESLSNMMVDTTPTSGDIKNAINHQGKILVNLAERVANISSDIHALRWIHTPFR